MGAPPTFYDLFGVSQRASADEIRAAYLWLMKQHHPDLAGAENRQKAADYAAALNRSYDILKDPTKRAHYDAFLERGKGVTKKKNSGRRALLTGRTRRVRRSRWDPTSVGTAALMGAALVLVGATFYLPNAPWSPAMDATSSVAAYQLAPEPAAGLPAAEVATQVRMAMSVVGDEAEATSERCFAAAGSDPDLSNAELCIIFDDAFLAWNETPEDALARPRYFSAPVLNERHRSSLGVLGTGREARLDELRNVAIAALLNQTRAEVHTPGLQGTDADQQSRSETDQTNFVLPS